MKVENRAGKMLEKRNETKIEKNQFTRVSGKKKPNECEFREIRLQNANCIFSISRQKSEFPTTIITIYEFH